MTLQTEKQFHTPRLFDYPMLGLYPMDIDTANSCLEVWGHRLGPIHRPFLQKAWSLEIGSQPISVAVSVSTVSTTVAELKRQEVVELGRLCSDPTYNWATRIMLRLWREICAQQWCWPVKAAIAYSHNSHGQGGNIYRFDGWEKIRDDCGSSGGGSWSRQRDTEDVVYGNKTLWLWRYD